MRFVHGSPNKFEKFELFDYTLNHNNKVAGVSYEGVIANGLDTNGPGIYCVKVSGNKEEIEVAESYSLQRGEKGYVYEFSVEEDEIFISDMPVEQFEEERWIRLMESFMRTLDEKMGFGDDLHENLVALAESRNSDGLDVQESDIQSMFTDRVEVSILEEIRDMQSLDPDEWAFSLMEEFDVYSRPSNNIIENQGTVADMLEWAKNSSENLWELTTNIWVQIATISNCSKGVRTYNKTFQDELRKEFNVDEFPPIAYIKGDDYYIVFDPESIQIENILEVQSEKNLSNDYGVSMD